MCSDTAQAAKKGPQLAVQGARNASSRNYEGVLALTRWNCEVELCGHIAVQVASIKHSGKPAILPGKNVLEPAWVPSAACRHP